MTHYRRQAGISLIEIMIAMTLGLMVLAALASLFANSSATRQEQERSSRQIENGRFAMELLGDDLRMAGFYGELDVKIFSAPGSLPDPCSTDATVWGTAIPVALQAYDNGASGPTCLSGVKSGTDILVVRRAATCEAGVSGCAAAVTGQPYLQVAKCSPQNASTTTAYRLGLEGTATFDRNLKNCTTVAGKRLYYVRIYYIATDNGAPSSPVSVPTLTRMDLSGSTWTKTPLVEGIEELNIEYGLDTDGDGQPNAYSADPTTYNSCAGGTAACVVTNWVNVVTARVSLLSRNLDASPNYTDTKTYTIGRNAAGTDQTVTPGGAYRRHVTTGVVRVLNVAERREVPP